MSRTTPLWLLWGAEEELEEGQGKGKEEVKGGERVCPCVCVCVSEGCKIKKERSVRQRQPVLKVITNQNER